MLCVNVSMFIAANGLFFDLCGVCNEDDSSADVVTDSSSQYDAVGKYIYVPCSHNKH